jgi:flagellar biosynthetic protein FliQ
MNLPDWYSVGAVRAFLALAAPSLAVCLLFGIGGAVLQTTTQIRESAIAFVPKAIGLLAVIAIAGGLMLHVAGQYARSVFDAIPTLIHDVRDNQ